MSPAAPPPLDQFITTDDLSDLIRKARREDLGPEELDVTSAALIGHQCIAQGHLVVREPGRLAGIALLCTIAAVYDPSLNVQLNRSDGDQVSPADVIASIEGPMENLLAMERVALNFISHLSGIATLTNQYVIATADTRAKIYDTRKTLPGLRGLQKYAVVCGGGYSHRTGLYDAMLIKDNHLCQIPRPRLRQYLSQAIHQVRLEQLSLEFIEVEIDRLDQLAPALEAGAQIVLLDNMTPDQLRQAVEVRDRTAKDRLLEASGGINLATIGAIAKSGVDRIAVGALTHSAPALDIGLDFA